MPGRLGGRLARIRLSALPGLPRERIEIICEELASRPLAIEEFIRVTGSRLSNLQTSGTVMTSAEALQLLVDAKDDDEKITMATVEIAASQARQTEFGISYARQFTPPLCPIGLMKKFLRPY